MAVKIYISQVSASNEVSIQAYNIEYSNWYLKWLLLICIPVYTYHILYQIKKRQQRAQMIMDSLGIKYNIVDVTEPGHEKERDQLQNVCKKRNSQTVALPPQFYNDDTYCGVSWNKCITVNGH